MSLPAISGAEPWHGSYRPLLFASSEADGNMPMEPVSIDASSDKISPKILPVKITSNCLGARTSCIAALSTYVRQRHCRVFLRHLGHDFAPEHAGIQHIGLVH